MMNHPPAKAQKPLFIIGQGALGRPDGAAILAMAHKAATSIGVMKEGWNGFNILHTAAGRVGALEVCALPGEGGKTTAQMLEGDLDVVFLAGADEIDMSKLAKAFVIYLGSHGDAGAARAD